MRECPSCASQVSVRNRFCGDCGADLTPRPATPTETSVENEVVQGRVRLLPRTIMAAALSNDTSDHVRFLPGTILANRYRIFGLLGRGGMGEVYRADDLKLGQPVALKFLPQGLERDQSSFKRFLNEVKLARQVSHPNVCRVYDVSEVDKQDFLSMEYVDGEDLASLLRRIGRLPRDKAVQIARQLCAGLAAAHAQGILHRDLKPANVMLDGRGRVRITDFGLAGLLKDSDGAELRVGTPGYMAPEQISGSGTSVRSDLYSLGLVLYELFTGRRAFDADTPAELARQQQEWFPTSPSALVQNLDPAVERIILRCLEQDVRHRPASAHAVAAALPGADPLTEVLETDETPSPELVAEIGVKIGLRPAIAWSCLAGLALMLAAGAWLGQKSRFLPHLPLDKPRGYLAERAREITHELGYREVPTDQAFGYAPNWDYLDHVWDPERFSESRDDLANAQPSAIRFWYRQSPDFLVPADYDVTRTDPAPALSGMIGVGLDTQGRLTSFEAVPPANLEDWPAGARPDWEMLLSEAGLDVNAMEPAEPQWNPPVFADSRAAWLGTYPDARDVSIRVEAAALGGRPVFFKVVEPWNTAARAPDSERNVWSRINSITPIFLFLPTLLGGALLARRNLRLGRGDQKGAFRLGAFMFALWLVFGILRSDHVPDLPEFWILLRALAMAFLYFGLFWILYVALEPYVRRFWPRVLVSWVRLLDGRFRDPLVARHLLIGGLFGCSALFIAHVGTLILQGQGQPAWGPGALGLQLSSLASFRYTLAGTLDLLDFAVTTSLEILVLLVLLRMLLRNRWLAVAGVYIAVTMLFAWPQDTRLAHAVVVALGLAILLRFGLLPMLAGLFVFVLLGNFLVSLDPFSAFAASSWFAATIVVVLTGYGFHYSLERRAHSKAAHAHGV